MIYLTGALGDIQQLEQINNAFSGIVYTINLAVQSMEIMRQSLGANIDTTALDAARAQITQVTDQIRQMHEELNRRTQPPPQPEWNQNRIEVFTNTGADRFRKEVADANSMLERLGDTQNQLVRRMFLTSAFPNEAFDDMRLMASRIDTIRERIRQIEENPLNFGSDAANAELEKLRTLLNAAAQAQEELNKAAQDADVGAANDVHIRLQQIVSDVERQIRDNVDEDGRIRSEGGDKKNGFISSVAKGAKQVFTMENVRRVIDLSDQMVEAKARLSLLVDDGGSVQELQDKVYASAQRAKVDYRMAVSAISNLDVPTFGSNDEKILFTELLNKQISNAGVTGAKAGTVMEKITGAMASGSIKDTALQDILNNVPALAENLQTYLAKVQNIDNVDLKALASKGMITAEVIKNALFYAADDINEKFESMPMTWGQAFQTFKNTALHAFTPVLEWVNGVANSDAFQNILGGITGAMQVLSVVLQGILNLVSLVGGFIADNWSVIEPLVWGIIAALVVYNAMMGIAWLTAAKGAVVKGVLTAITAAQNVLNAVMAASPIMWVILGMIAVVAVIAAICNAVAKMSEAADSGFSVFIGWIFVVIAALKNFWLFLLNIAIGIGDVIKVLGTNIGVVFHNVICSVKSWWYGLLSVVLEVVGSICEALNQLPFVEFEYSGIIAAAEEYANKSWEAAKDKKEYESFDGVFDKGFHTYNAFEDGWVSKAFEAGAALGNSIGNKVKGLFDGIFGGDDIPGLDDIPNPEEYLGQTGNELENSGVAGNVGDIAANTGDIADAMTVTQEDLKYLRDIAEQEAVNRFTTAEITVDMSGMQNTMNNNGDLDGFISRMTAAVREAVDSMTEGVHG